MGTSIANGVIASAVSLLLNGPVNHRHRHHYPLKTLICVLVADNLFVVFALDLSCLL